MCTIVMMSTSKVKSFEDSISKTKEMALKIPSLWYEIDKRIAKFQNVRQQFLKVWLKSQGVQSNILE